MHNVFRGFVVLIILLSSYVTGDTPVHFEDINLKRAVENAIGSENPTVADMENLKKLDASGYGITDLTGLETAINLTNLNLNDNKLRDIPEFIGNFRGLYFLNARNNQIGTIPDSIGNLTKLVRLDLHNNGITDVPDTLRNCTKLCMIYFSSNFLTDVPESLQYLNELVYLNVNNNYIEDIPTFLWDLEHFSSLFIENNRISSIPEGISKLKHLSHFSVAHNNIDELPEELFDSPELMLFYCNSNSLTSISPNIYKLSSSLTDLSIGDNPLECVPAEIGDLLSLKYVFMWNVNGCDVSQSAGRLKDLKVLQLSGNNFPVDFHCKLVPIIVDNNPYADIFTDVNEHPMLWDCVAGLEDLALFSSHWLNVTYVNCQYNEWCEGADINHDDIVNLIDYSLLVDYWNE